MSEMLFFKLMARCLGDRMNQLPEKVLPQFAEVFRRFLAACSRVLPRFTPQEIAMRMSFAVGALLQTAAHAEVMEKMSRGLMATPETEDLLKQILDFSEAGFNAAPQTSTPPSR